MARILRSDKLFFASIVALIIAGFVIFSSASLGLLARQGASFSVVALKQALLAIVGIIVMLGSARVPYTFWRKYALVIFCFSLLATVSVFIPHLGFSSGGSPCIRKR